MNYLDMVRKCTKDYKNKIVNIEKTKEELYHKLKNEIIGQRFYDDKCHELDELINATATEGKAEIDKINDSFKEYQRFKYGAKGENVDMADLELLRGDFDITQADADRLKEKYIKAKNYTMLNALKKYAKEHNLNVVYNEQETEENYQFDLFAEFCKAAIIDNINFENIDTYYDKVIAHFQD